MSFIAFEHAISEKNPFRREIMKRGSGGEIIHVEFILPSFNYLRASSWNNIGVGFKEELPNLKEYIVYEIGNYDNQIYEYFKAREALGYDFKSIVFGMILKMNPIVQDKFFCSEIVYDFLINQLKFNLPVLIPSQVSPQKLYELVQPLGFNQIYF